MFNIKSPKDNLTNRATGKLCPIFLRLPSDSIVELKFTLESYDELGIIRTLNASRGEIVILGLSDTEKELREFLESVKEELQVTEIQAPIKITEDWLLSDSPN